MRSEAQGGHKHLEQAKQEYGDSRVRAGVRERGGRQGRVAQAQPGEEGCFPWLMHSMCLGAYLPRMIAYRPMGKAVQVLHVVQQWSQGRWAVLPLGGGSNGLEAEAEVELMAA